MTQDIIDITPDEFRTYTSTHSEREYILVDVRQPEEYAGQHIPGATLIPLATIEEEVEQLLHSQRDIIFTCRSGARSRTAAAFAVEKQIGSGKIFNMSGGIMGWNGKTLPDLPKLSVLGQKRTMDEVLLAAMDLEKGTWNYYTTIADTFPDRPFTPTIKYLSMAETAHAEALYEIWKKRQQQAPEFDDLFWNLKGDIIEGGMKLNDVMGKITGTGKDLDMNILELSLEIEYSAYDLYRSAAHRTEDVELSSLLLRLADSEKAHIMKLSEAFSLYSYQ